MQVDDSSKKQTQPTQIIRLSSVVGFIPQRKWFNYSFLWKLGTCKNHKNPSCSILGDMPQMGWTNNLNNQPIYHCFSFGHRVKKWYKLKNIWLPICPFQPQEYIILCAKNSLKLSIHMFANPIKPSKSCKCWRFNLTKQIHSNPNPCTGYHPVTCCHGTLPINSVQSMPGSVKVPQIHWEIWLESEASTWYMTRMTRVPFSTSLEHVRLLE